MTPEGHLCVRTFYYKGIMNLHIHFQNEPELVTQDQELEDKNCKLLFNSKHIYFPRMN